MPEGGNLMREKLLQLGGVAMILLTLALGNAKTVQACIHECVIFCSPGTHCCIVNGCAGCYTVCPPA
jgi:hypothetical protein